MPATTFIAEDPEAEALLPELRELAAAHPLERTIRVRVSDRPSQATVLRRPAINIDRADIGQPWTRGMLAHEYGHLADPLAVPIAVAQRTLMPWGPSLALILTVLLGPYANNPATGYVALSALSFSIIPLLLIAFSISRVSEYRVDALAADILQPDTRPLLAMFEELDTKRTLRTWLSTHPKPMDRYAAIAGGGIGSGPASSVPGQI